MRGESISRGRETERDGYGRGGGAEEEIIEKKGEAGKIEN